MTGVLGYKIYIEQENSYIPSNSFYDLVGLSMIPIRDRDPLEIVDDTLNVIGAYPIIYFKEKYYELIYSKDTGFKPVIIEDLSIVSTWLINPADELITVRDYNLYETQSNKLLHELPSSIVNRLKNTKRVAFYKFIEDPTGIRESYELTDKSKITKALLSNIRLSENVSQSLSSVNIVFELTCPSVILKNSNNLSFTDSNNNSISFNVSSVANGFSITPTSTISTVGIYTISIPANTVYIFGENGQIEICPAYTFQYRIIEPSTDITTTGNDRSYYHGLLHIDNTDQNVTSANEVSFRLNDTDTILINKDKNPTISLVPQLYRVKGLISEVIPYNEISGVLFTYSYYDNEVLVTTNTNIDYYSQAGDQTDILSEVGLSNPVYIKCSVQFTYRSNTIQQGFELYFLSNSLYTSIQSNQNYYVSGYIDTQNGQVAEQKCGCLLLTNLYDIYKTIEVVENNQTVVKGIADIVPNTKVRMGNLTGIHNYTFGKNQPRGYGLYGESVYLTGNFYLNNGRSLVDIDRDILLAVGNIKEVERYLESLESSIRATIEANSIITEANYTGAISVNNNALLRLGLDYSLWALGNAGIVLMNPNATYNADGEVEPSTVGDGDEAILMQGDSIKFTNYKTKELTIDNVTATYKEVICSNVSPTGWQYNSSIYQPSDGNNLVEFYLGYILDYPTTKNHIDRLENQSSQEYLKYVGFTDISGQTGCITDTGTFTSSPNPKEYYLFNSYYVLPSNGTVYDKDGNVISHPGEVFILPRVVIAGMFKNGKFNSDFIETKNLLAFDETIGHGFIRNPNFDITQPVSDSNYPVLNGTTNQIDKTAPFVVISGTTGQMVAQGINLKEATIGEDYIIHLTDNQGYRKEENVDYPGIYIKNSSNQIVSKFSGIGSYTEDSSIIQEFEGNKISLTSNTSFTHTFDSILKRKLYVFDNSGSSTVVKSADESSGTKAIINNFYPGYCSVTIYNYGVSGSYKVDNGQEQYFRTNGRPGSTTSIVRINNIKQWISGSNGQDSTIELYISTSSAIVVSGGYVNRTNNSNSITLNHFYGNNLAIYLYTSGNDSNTTNSTHEYSGNPDDLFNSDIGSVRYFVNSGNTKFIQNINQFTLQPGKSKMIDLISAETDITLGITNSYYYKANQGANVTTLYPNGTDILPPNFYGRVELITGFRVSWNTVTYDYYNDDIPISITTKHHKWLSKEICYVERTESGVLKQTTKQNQSFSSGFVDVTNNSNSDRIYTIEYAAIIQISNNYDIQKTQNSSSGSLTPHILSSDIVPFDQQIFDPTNYEYIQVLPDNEVIDSDDLNWTSVVNASYYPSETISDWTPAIFPVNMNFSTSSITIYNYNIKVVDNNLITLVQGNGLGVGVNDYNYFVSNLIEKSLQTKILSNNFGIMLDSSGLSNIFNGSQLKTSFNIFQGRIGTPIKVGRTRPSYDYKYNFIGTSLNQNKNLSNIESYTCNGSLFRYYSSYSSDTYNSLLNGQYRINYIQEHDIYLIEYINKTFTNSGNIYIIDTDAIVIIFGNSWTSIFNKFGIDENQTYINVQAINRKDSNYNIESEHSFYPTVYQNKLFNNAGQVLTLTKSDNSTEDINVYYNLQVNMNGEIEQYTTRSGNIVQTPVIGDFGIQIQYTPNI